MIKEYKFQIGGNSPIDRWNDIIPEYESIIDLVLDIAKNKLNFFQRRLLNLMYIQLKRKVPYSRELVGLSRKLNLHYNEILFYQTVCEYFIHGTTIITRPRCHPPNETEITYTVFLKVLQLLLYLKCKNYSYC